LTEYGPLLREYTLPFALIFPLLYENVTFAGVLKKVIEKCVDGASCRKISEEGDELLIEECSKFFKKEKELKRGTFLRKVTIY